MSRQCHIIDFAESVNSGSNPEESLLYNDGILKKKLQEKNQKCHILQRGKTLLTQKKSFN